MSNRNFRLVLKCLALAVDVVRLVSKLDALLNVIINYPQRNEPQVVF